MKTLTLVLLSVLFSLNASADPVCTKEPREKWMKAEEMKKIAAVRGYKIKLFKTLEYCFEITGTKDGKPVDQLFDPASGKEMTITSPQL